MAEDEKQRVRNHLLSGRRKSDREISPGAIAEQLRSLDTYKKAKQLYVAPAKVLSQVRINTLVDGKKLIVPTAGLREGFWVVKPYTVPFAKLSFAVTNKGLPQYASRLVRRELSQLSIDLLIADALAVDDDGYFISDGKGYFDIACGILCYVNALRKGFKSLAVVEYENIKKQPLPHDPWDVQLDGVLSEKGLFFIDRQESLENRCTDIYWEQLPFKRIRKIDPLWYLYSKK